MIFLKLKKTEKIFTIFDQNLLFSVSKLKFFFLAEEVERKL